MAGVLSRACVPIAAWLVASCVCGATMSMAMPAGAPASQVGHGGMGGPHIDTTRLPNPVVGFADERVKPTTELPPDDSIGAFRTTCSLSHMSFDDPLVHPGEPGASHLHAFFGNTETSAATTIESLRGHGNSTCRGGTANRSAYWVPAIIDSASGAPVLPSIGNFYYKQGYEIKPATAIQPIPAGLRMIAGNAANSKDTGGPFRFSCFTGSRDTQKSSTRIPDCEPGTTGLLSEVMFPPCWNGHDLDAPDHASHMSYVAQDRSAPFAKHCPASHPIALPTITFNIWYPVGAAGTAHWRLSSDMYDPALPGGYSMHGDWMNGWKPEISDAWAKHCLEASKDCHSHLLGDGRAIF